MMTVCLHSILSYLNMYHVLFSSQQRVEGNKLGVSVFAAQ